MLLLHWFSVACWLGHSAYASTKTNATPSDGVEYIDSGFTLSEAMLFRLQQLTALRIVDIVSP